jgi:hypothetical protein
MNPKSGITIMWLGVLLFSETFSPVNSPADEYASKIKESRIDMGINRVVTVVNSALNTSKAKKSEGRRCFGLSKPGYLFPAHALQIP